MDNKTYTDINIDDFSSNNSNSNTSEINSPSNKNKFYAALAALIGISLMISFMIFSKKATTPSITKINTTKITIPVQVVTQDRKIVLNSADISDKNIYEKSTSDKNKQTELPPPTEPYTVAKNIAVKNPTPTATPIKPTVEVKRDTSTPKPTVITAKPTVIAQKPSRAPIATSKSASDTYTVKAGDSLWKISEQVYGTGFKANDIAKANKIAQADIIYTGQKLVLPKTDSKIVESKPVAKSQPKPEVTTKPEILAANTKATDQTQKYTVQKGDNLWTIAVYFYADGFQWNRIAEANKLTNPRVIHSGNILAIPAK